MDYSAAKAALVVMAASDRIGNGTGTGTGTDFTTDGGLVSTL